MRRYIPFVAVGVVMAMPLWILFGPRDLICSGDRIKTPEQAVTLAKRLIVARQGPLQEAGIASGDEYIAAIERNPKCCTASYGPRLIKGAGDGWRVTISAMHLPNEYEHLVEFDRCGAVSYNGGVSMKGAIRRPAPPQPQ